MTDSTGPKISSFSMVMPGGDVTEDSRAHIIAAVEMLRPAGVTGDERRAFLDAGPDQPLNLGADQLGSIGQLAPRRRLICATSPTLN